MCVTYLVGCMYVCVILEWKYSVFFYIVTH
jgi:hypothetical protein